jgi:hypothetical protein
MQRFEYKVIPAPKKAEKVRGAKTTGDRFAVSLTQLMNSLGAEGWDYVRADTLPCEERVGFTGKTTTFQNMLVFRRPLEAAVTEMPAAAEPAPVFAPLSRDGAGREAAIRPLGSPLVEPGSAPAVGPARPELAAE